MADMISPLLEGPVDTEQWCSIGFRTNDPRSVRSVRVSVIGLLKRWGIRNLADFYGDVGLIASELVANVIEHANCFHSGSITLWFKDRSELLLSVHDRSPEHPKPEPKVYSGRGFLIVMALAQDRRGKVEVESDWDGRGKVVKVWLRVP